MKVFVFDLLAYGEQVEHLKVGNELPYPLPNKYFKPEVAARPMPSTWRRGKSSTVSAMTESGSTSTIALLMG